MSEGSDEDGLDGIKEEEGEDEDERNARLARERAALLERERLEKE